MLSQSKTIVFPIIFFLLFLILTGCSDRVKISGTVTYDDGKPLTQGSVCFRSEDGTTYQGYLDKDGHYSPGEFKDGDGIPFGKYKVWVAGSDESVERPGKNGGISQFQIIVNVDSQYTSPDTGKLNFEVKSGSAKTFDFTVEHFKENAKNKKHH
jgi:hypothetical protein